MRKKQSNRSEKLRQSPSLKKVKNIDRALPLTTSCGVLTSQMSIPIDFPRSLGKTARGIDIMFQCYQESLKSYEADSLQVSFYQSNKFIENRIFNFHELMLLSETGKVSANYPVKQIKVHIPTKNIPVFKDAKIRLFLGEIALNPDLPFNFNVKIMAGKKEIAVKVGEISCSAY